MIFSESRHEKRGLSQPHTIMGGNIKTPKENRSPSHGVLGIFKGMENPLKHRPHQASEI